MTKRSFCETSKFPFEQKHFFSFPSFYLLAKTSEFPFAFSFQPLALSTFFGFDFSLLPFSKRLFFLL